MVDRDTQLIRRMQCEQYLPINDVGIHMKKMSTSNIQHVVVFTFNKPILLRCKEVDGEYHGKYKVLKLYFNALSI